LRAVSDLISAIDALPPLREAITAHGLLAKKSLGQNFLLDLNITDKIAMLAGDLSGVHVFEIGPGPGGLTRSLLKTNAKKVTAIEFDTRAIDALQELKKAAGERLEIIQGDALKSDLTALGAAPRAVVANLPYNIATPLLIGWLEQVKGDAGAFKSFTLMFQKEVAERMAAPPGNKTYGRLAVIAQWLCDVRVLYELPPSAFTPPPKVTSCVVRLIPKKLENNQPSFEAVERVTAAAFQQRRKMIRGSLKAYAHKFVALGIDETLRAENLSVAQFIELAR
jgi:16S rRNA (adenine1518-N6/adenine1519-N6)-dimethyltransferase